MFLRVFFLWVCGGLAIVLVHDKEKISLKTRVLVFVILENHYAERAVFKNTGLRIMEAQKNFVVTSTRLEQGWGTFIQLRATIFLTGRGS